MQSYYAAIVTVLAVFGMVWKMTSETKKCFDDKTRELHLDHENKMRECKDECDMARARVYQRFDEYKEHLERTHVSREVHDIKYDQLRESIDEIKGYIKKIFERMETNG